MTLNGDPPNKKFLREVITLATAKFLHDGGTISRERGRKVMLVGRRVTLNSGPDNRAAVREELDALVRVFISNGGSITRGRHHRVGLSCTSCRAHRYLELGYYLKFHPRCLCCGGEMKAER